MSNALPDFVDPWRMAQARRGFAGSIALRQFSRLAGMLASTDGELNYRVDFGRDESGVTYLDVHADADLVLTCQRTLQAFALPVRIDQRLGLIREEAQEAALPEGYEPLLVADGKASIRDVIEDEMILALPLVALSPGAPLEQVALGESKVGSEVSASPFAVLGSLGKLNH
ncbi:MAG: DNA-binding protein [Gammaproteobacteria bacterium]|nr:MAG: DNA-binding protein [Gammaproteobacteria bacterium]